MFDMSKNTNERSMIKYLVDYVIQDQFGSGAGCN